MQLLAAFGGAVAATALLIWAATWHARDLDQALRRHVLGLALGSLLQTTAEIIGMALLIASVVSTASRAGPTKVTSSITSRC